MTDRDQYLVIHDCAITVIALMLAGISLVVTREPVTPVVAFVLASLIGVALMRFGPTRRKINDVAMTLTRNASE
ncbi:hypothetical protein ABT282_08180 [Streptomyces sp. NPDC000927]|uniref:hypothetical protein n=1 Tax=Streptomyces sp. NPDC000927 TaxID=3154371 RepID=UPI00332A07FC